MPDGGTEHESALGHRMKVQCTLALFNNGERVWHHGTAQDASAQTQSDQAMRIEGR